MNGIVLVEEEEITASWEAGIEEIGKCRHRRIQLELSATPTPTTAEIRRGVPYNNKSF